MAWIMIQEPGTKHGPCAGTCAHRDCAQSRADAAGMCSICARACGYGVELTGSPLKHLACVLNATESAADASTTPAPCPSYLGTPPDVLTCSLPAGHDGHHEAWPPGMGRVGSWSDASAVHHGAPPAPQSQHEIGEALEMLAQATTLWTDAQIREVIRGLHEIRQPIETAWASCPDNIERSAALRKNLDALSDAVNLLHGLRGMKLRAQHPDVHGQSVPWMLVLAARRLRDAALAIDARGDRAEHQPVDLTLDELRAAAAQVTAALEVKPQAPRHDAMMERTFDALERILSREETEPNDATVNAHDIGAINTVPPVPTPEPER